MTSESFAEEMKAAISEDPLGHLGSFQTGCRWLLIKSKFIRRIEEDLVTIMNQTPDEVAHKAAAELLKFIFKSKSEVDKL